MISELKKAIEKTEQLTQKEQRVIAKLIIDEIGWDKTLLKTHTQLSSLAEEALNEYKKGKTKPLQF